MKDEHEKITEVEDLPKDDDEYMERLLKKNPGEMNIEELKDYLDYIILRELERRPEECMKYLLNQMLICFRILDLQTNLIMGRADANNHFVKAICLFLKEKYPDDYEDITAVAGEIAKEHDMMTLKDLPIITQERIMDKANRILKKGKAQGRI